MGCAWRWFYALQYHPELSQSFTPGESGRVTSREVRMSRAPSSADGRVAGSPLRRILTATGPVSADDDIHLRLCSKIAKTLINPEAEKMLGANMVTNKDTV